MLSVTLAEAGVQIAAWTPPLKTCCGVGYTHNAAAGHERHKLQKEWANCEHLCAATYYYCCNKCNKTNNTLSRRTNGRQNGTTHSPLNKLRSCLRHTGRCRCTAVHQKEAQKTEIFSLTSSSASAGAHAPSAAKATGACPVSTESIPAA